MALIDIVRIVITLLIITVNFIIVRIIELFASLSRLQQPSLLPKCSFTHLQIPVASFSVDFLFFLNFISRLFCLFHGVLAEWSFVFLFYLACKVLSTLSLCKSHRLFDYQRGLSSRALSTFLATF